MCVFVQRLKNDVIVKELNNYEKIKETGRAWRNLALPVFLL